MNDFDELVAKIERRAAKFQTDYGIPPNSICIGPQEFATLTQGMKASSPSVAGRDMSDMETSGADARLAPIFLHGIRVYRLSSPGVFVGCLNHKEPINQPMEKPRPE